MKKKRDEHKTGDHKIGDRKNGKAGNKPDGITKKKGGPKKHDTDGKIHDGKFDFGDMKVHADSGIGPGALGASAFTMGEEIAFKKESAGSKLLAHELTHTVQQRGNGRDSEKKSRNAGLDQKDKLEAAFGADFGKVNVHHDAKKPDLGAAAFARGDGIALGAAADGKRSAHEAAHAIQQSQQAKQRGAGIVDRIGPRPEKPAGDHKVKPPTFLEHPAADGKKPPGGKLNGESSDHKAPGSADKYRKGKPTVPADAEHKLEVPLDTDTLGALTDRIYDKLDRESKSERDRMGS